MARSFLRPTKSPRAHRVHRCGLDNGVAARGPAHDGGLDGQPGHHPGPDAAPDKRRHLRNGAVCRCSRPCAAAPAARACCARPPASPMPPRLHDDFSRPSRPRPRARGCSARLATRCTSNNCLVLSRASRSSSWRCSSLMSSWWCSTLLASSTSWCSS